MDTFVIVAVVVLIVLIIISIAGYFINKKHKTQKDKPKEKKEKKAKMKKEKLPTENKPLELKGSYVDVVDKFLYRKEFKLLVLISRVLPKGYIAFPRIGADTILEPVGNKALYNSIIGKYIDVVIFDEVTLKPKVAIDIYDGTIGDEQLDVETPEIVEALKSAELPLITIKVKTEYTTEEIEKPIKEALGITENVQNLEEVEQEKTTEEA